MMCLQLELSTDADRNGDACMTRSVSGMHLELVNPKSGNVFPLAWRSSGAISHGLRHVGLPVQDFVQEFLGERIPLVCLVDNQQAITAVKRGYSKRLRCLNLTHRIAIGPLHEIVGDERQQVDIRYIESKLQKGNIYTKAMVPAQFSDCPSHAEGRVENLWKFLCLFVRLSLNSLASSQFGRIDFVDIFVHCSVESPLE